MNRERLLIVDDHEDLRRLLRLTVRFANYQVVEAEDAAGALDTVKVWRPDVILLDVMMPGELSGLDACRTLKADPGTAGIFVILVTARDDFETIIAAREAGADAYMVKPFKPARLVELIARRMRVSYPILPDRQRRPPATMEEWR